MIAAWFSKAATPLIVLGLMVLAGMLIAWATLATVDGLVGDARASAITERDAHWLAEIEKVNALALAREAAQAREALRIETETSARVRAAEDELEQRKIDSAALANADACGLSRDRVRLLPD